MVQYFLIQAKEKQRKYDHRIDYLRCHFVILMVLDIPQILIDIFDILKKTKS